MEIKQDEILISVVVCTYNRCDVLELCLESLVNQTLDKNLYEVIIVNNNSTDDTEKVIKKYVDANKTFRSFIELKQGSSYAKNRGTLEANGKFLAFIDDDGIAFPDWLEKISDFIKRHKDISAFGGPYIGYSNKDFAIWLPKGFGSWGLGFNEKKINIPNEWLCGSNMIINKKIFFDIGGFDISKGPKGKKYSYGEDTFLITKINEINKSIWYSPNIKIKHLIEDKKLKFPWILISGFKAGKVDEIIFNRKHNLFYYIILFIFHIFKYGIKLINIKKFGENVYNLFHTLSYDIGLILSKFMINKKYDEKQKTNINNY